MLALQPATQQIRQGETFTITIQVRTNQPVDGAAAFVDFDASGLSVVSVTPGPALSVVLQNQVDSTLGRLSFVAGTLSAPYPTHDFVLATVVFTATGSITKPSLSFASTDPQKSDVTFSGSSVLAGREPATITVVP